MVKKIWIVAFCLFLGFFLTTIFEDNGSPSRVTRDQTSLPLEKPLVIGYSNWAGWWPWKIAEQEGLFDKNGANIELKWYDHYSQSLADLNNGVIDGNCQTLSDTIIFSSDAKKGEVAILVNDNSAGNDKIIGAKGIETVEDLKGKSLALEVGVVSDFLLSLALEDAGLGKKQLNIVDMETGAAAEAFAANRADAVATFPPFWLKALSREGSGEITSSEDFPGAIPDLLVVSQDVINKRSKEVQVLVNTWFDILDFIEKNPERADQIMAEVAEVDTEKFKLFKEGTRMFDLKDNLNAFKKGSDMTHLNFSGEKTKNFLDKNGENTVSAIVEILNSEFVKHFSSIQLTG